MDGAQPLKQRAYRHGPAQDAEIERQVKELKDHGLIKEGKGAWSSPVVLVQKKDGKWRFCVDYRKLNDVTIKDAYPLPRIDDSLDSLGKSKVFSTLDLTSGYWQVELDQDAKEKSAFVTRSGLYEWEVLPFGLTSAPSTFERLMETALRGLHWKSVLIYLDDIIVFAPDVDSHVERLAEVFGRLRAAGLKLKPEKCRLFADRVQYLGHTVSHRGIETDQTKVDAVKEWPQPRHKRDVRAFLGTCGYYRRFIQNYSELSRPLSQLSSKSAPFKWTQECHESFEGLKRRLTTAPILAYPDYSLPFVLDTDASAVGTGAVLSQVQEGQERVVAYYSKMMSAEERNYCVTRQELVAVVKAIIHFRPQLYGREFTVRTDHASLSWLLRTPQPQGQVARWIATLSEYNFRLEYRKGRKHNNADGLSRQLCANCRQCERMWGPRPIPSPTRLPVECDATREPEPSVGSGTASREDLVKPRPRSCPIKDKKTATSPSGGAKKPSISQIQQGRTTALQAARQLAPPPRRTAPDERSQPPRRTLPLQGETKPPLATWSQVVRRGLTPRQEQPASIPLQEATGLDPPMRSQETQVRPALPPTTLARQQQADENLRPVMEALQYGRTFDVHVASAETAQLWKLKEHLRVLPDGTLVVHGTRSARPVCPGDQRASLVLSHHGEAHLGISKVTAAVRLRWYWPGMTSLIRRLITRCTQCQQAKTRGQKQRADNHLHAGRPWQVLAIDLYGPFPKTQRGNSVVLVMTDHFTRWSDAIPLPDGKAVTIAKALDERVFAYFGIPEAIHSDQGQQFQSELFLACCELWGCEKTRTSPYRPEGNSIVERLNRTLGNSLRALLVQDPTREWDDLLPQIMRTVRATPHRVTQETANYLMLGRETRLPPDLLHPTELPEFIESDYAIELQNRLQEVGRQLRERQRKQPRQDTEAPTLYKPGDEVWLKSYYKGTGRGAKLQPKYVGPYKVIRALPYQAYEVERRNRRSIQHEGRIRLYYPPEQDENRGSASTRPDESAATTPEEAVQKTVQEPHHRQSILDQDVVYLSDIWKPSQLTVPEGDPAEMEPIIDGGSVLGGDLFTLSPHIATTPETLTDPGPAISPAEEIPGVVDADEAGQDDASRTPDAADTEDPPLRPDTPQTLANLPENTPAASSPVEGTLNSARNNTAIGSPPTLRRSQRTSRIPTRPSVEVPPPPATIHTEDRSVVGATPTLRRSQRPSRVPTRLGKYLTHAVETAL